MSQNLGRRFQPPCSRKAHLSRAQRTDLISYSRASTRGGTVWADRGARREAFPTLDDPRQVAEALLAHVLHLARSRAGSQAVHTGCTGLWPGRALLRARIVGDACRFVSHLSTILRRCPVRLTKLSRGPAGSLHRTQTISQAAMTSLTSGALLANFGKALPAGSAGVRFRK